jgi:hypothetical protein
MTWLIAPIADRLIVRKMLRAIDVLLGYPRVHAESELRRVGRGPHAATVRTETQCAVMVNTSLGAIAVSVDAVIQALRDRTVQIDGESVRVRIDDLGWQVRADLPGNIANWAPVAARDGGAGSPTGVPVP